MSKRAPILCVRRELGTALLNGREGFIPVQEGVLDASTLLALENAHFIPRHLVEEDESFLQIIPYTFLRDRERGVYLYYVRAEGGEKRLEGRTSVGFGGHVELAELVQGADVAETVRRAARREIEEELFGLSVGDDFDAVGVILANDTPVDRVHLGLVFELPLHTLPTGFSDEIHSVHLGSAEEILARPNVETWTRLVLDSRS